MRKVIIDASVSLCWYFENQATAYTEAVFDCLAGGYQALMPAIWPLEMVNALVVAWRQKIISVEYLENCVRDLKDLPVEIGVQGMERICSPVFRLSRQYQLSTYDAVYLDLAVLHDLPLATLDKNLRAAAQRLSVQLFDP